MKEFIEKLISRLKKYQIEYKSGFGELTDETVFRVMENVIYTINQLAEEYNTDIPTMDINELFEEVEQNENKITTNADRIRAMSDEELADKIMELHIEHKIPFCKSKEICNEIQDTGQTIPDEMCRLCLITWLQSEAK